MKKQNLLLLLSSSLLLGACAGNETSSFSSSAESSLPSSETIVTPESAKIVLNDIPEVEQGKTIDLSNYVHIENGDSSKHWTYTILVDSAHASLVSEVASDAPSVFASTKLLCLRSGRVNFRVDYDNESKFGYFDITENLALKDLTSKIAKLQLSNYTVSKAFEMNENYEPVSKERVPTLYHNDKYVYLPNSYYGIAIHQGTHLGYYYQINGVEEKYQSSFHVMTNADKTALSETSFKATFGNLGSYFTSDTMRYFAAAGELLGEDSSYCLAYETATKDLFNSALTNLGMSYQHAVNGKTYYTIAIVPKFVNDKLCFYGISANTSGYAFLEGPYVLNNIGTTKIEAVENWINSEVAMNYANNDALATRLDGITGYTSTLKGVYEDLEGNKIEAPDYFKDSLPEINSTIEWNTNYFHSTWMSAVDGGEEDNVLLENATANGSKVVNRYVLNNEGKYTKKEVLEHDPTSGYVMDDWQKGQTFSYYLPRITFPSLSWKYSAIEDLGDDTYFLSGFNDAIGRNTIRYVVAGLSAYKYFGDSSAFAYFGAYDMMKINLGKKLTDDISGDVYTRLMNLSTKEYYVYHITFSITKINTTVISSPVAA